MRSVKKRLTKEYVQDTLRYKQKEYQKQYIFELNDILKIA